MTDARLEKQRRVLNQAKSAVEATSRDKKVEVMKEWNVKYYVVRVPLTEVRGRERDKSAAMTVEWGEFCLDVIVALKKS